MRFLDWLFGRNKKKKQTQENIPKSYQGAAFKTVAPTHNESSQKIAGTSSQEIEPYNKAYTNPFDRTNMFWGIIPDSAINDASDSSSSHNSGHSCATGEVGGSIGCHSCSSSSHSSCSSHSCSSASSCSSSCGSGCSSH